MKKLAIYLKVGGVVTAYAFGYLFLYVSIFATIGINYYVQDHKKYSFIFIPAIMVGISSITAFLDMINMKLSVLKAVKNFCFSSVLYGGLLFANSYGINWYADKYGVRSFWPALLTLVFGFVINPVLIGVAPYAILFFLNKYSTRKKIIRIINKLPLSKAHSYRKKFEENIMYIYDDNMELREYQPEKLMIDNESRSSLIRKLMDETKIIINSRCENNLTYADMIVQFNPEKYVDKATETNAKAAEILKRYADKKNEIINLYNARSRFLSKSLYSSESGTMGEEYITKEMNKYENMYNLSNIRIEVPDNEGINRSSENDNVIITTKGIFILEVKNYARDGQFELHIERDGAWNKVYKNGNSIPEKSATSQNNRHIYLMNRYINKILNRNISNYISAKGIVVIANEEVKIVNKSENELVVRASQIYNYINKQKDCLTINEMNIIRDALLRDNLPPKDFELMDFRNELKINIDKFYKFRNETKDALNELYKVLN